MTVLTTHKTSYMSRKINIIKTQFVIINLLPSELHPLISPERLHNQRDLLYI